MLNWNNECGVKLCEIYDEGCSSLSFDYTCKIRDGTELEMETQSDTRHNLKTTPTPTPTVSLHCEKLPPPCHLFIKKKKKKKMSKSWYVTMCIANKLKQNNKYVFISCRPQKTSVLGQKWIKKRWQTLQSSRRRSESGPAHSSIHPRDAERPWAGHNRSIIQWPSCF